MVKSAYIHIPFCNNICSYCDFCKMYYNKDFIDKYLLSLEKEINLYYKNDLLNLHDSMKAESLETTKIVNNIIKDYDLNNK